MEHRFSAAVAPTRIDTSRAGELAFWARILDEHPDALRRAVDHAGPEIAAVRTALAARQLRLDFDALRADRRDA
jgi:hypothetical protein